MVFNMDNYTLILAKDDTKTRDITKLIGNLSWSDNVDTLGTQLSFDSARNRDDKNLKDYIKIGDKIILSNNSKEVFRGIITDLDWSRYGKSVTAFDYAFYLNQSKTVKQFKKIAASEAITQLCKVFNMPIGSITKINTKISKIYKDKTIAEIIKDILTQAEKELGYKFRLETREGKLYIEKYTDLIVNATFQPYENAKSIDVLTAIGNISKKESIQNMRNSILITSDDEKDSSIKVTKDDPVNIKLYGLLQEVSTEQGKNKSETENIAKNKLKELNRVQTDITLDLLGNDILRSGRIINLTNSTFDITGKFIIQSSNHTYDNKIHKTTIVIKEEV